MIAAKIAINGQKWLKNASSICTQEKLVSKGINVKEFSLLRFKKTELLDSWNLQGSTESRCFPEDNSSDAADEVRQLFCLKRTITVL